MRFGLGVPRSRRTFMGNGSGVSRGDRNRNARLELLNRQIPLLAAACRLFPRLTYWNRADLSP
jgi:hypothetical protein